MLDYDAIGAIGAIGDCKDYARRSHRVMVYALAKICILLMILVFLLLFLITTGHYGQNSWSVIVNRNYLLASKTGNTSIG